MSKPKSQLLSIPFYLYLLPVFFVLHGLVEKFPLTGYDILMFLSLYSGIALLLSFLFWLVFKDLRKASILAFCILTFQLFFGSLHDFLKKSIGQTFLVKYSFMIPFVIVVLAVAIFYTRKSKRSFSRVTKYLNLVLIVLLLVDGLTLLVRERKNHKESVSGLIQICDTCAKPDVYLIIADEYAGKQQLKDIFSFDNSEFENALRSRGFSIVNNPRSNYNFTTYSTASLLNMQYIQNLESNTINQNDFFICRELIKKNELVEFFQNNGYDIYNCSFFDLKNKQRATTSKYFPPPRKMLTTQTFTSRVNFDLGYHFASREIIERILKQNLYNIRDTDSLTKSIASKETNTPKFVYTHLMMPHHPYFFDRNGKEASIEKLEDSYKEDMKAYVDYLQYANKKLLELVDHIKTASSKPPVIVLMSDHGFRQSRDSATTAYQFMTLNAVHLPNGNYRGFYDGMSNVNQFRVILNSQFGQRLPLLKDSSIFMKE